jgi:hypothetical protein
MLKHTIRHTTLISSMSSAMFAAMLFTTLAAGHAHADSKADSTFTTERRTVAPFSSIHLGIPYQVIITADTGNTIELSGPRDKLADIETTVSGDTLTVRRPSRNGWSFNFSAGKDAKPLTVRISAANLKLLRNGGSGDVELQQFHGQALTLVSSGSGDVQASGDARALTVTSSGSGDLDLSRLKAGSLDIIASGSGDVSASGVTNDLNVAVSGSGDIDITDIRAGQVNASVRGSGDITLDGSARELHAELSGSGELDAHRLTTGQADVKVRGSGEATVRINDKGGRERLVTYERKSSRERSVN